MKEKSPCSRRERTPKQKKILAIKAENPTLSQSQIATLAGCERSMVSRTWTQYGIDHDEINFYKLSRADVFDTLALRIIRTITEDDIKKASLLQRLSGLGIVYDKMRVERGLGDASSKPMVHIHIAGSDAKIQVNASPCNADNTTPLIDSTTYNNE